MSSLRIPDKQREEELARHRCLVWEISRLVRIEQLVFEQVGNHMITYYTDRHGLSRESTELAAMLLETKSRGSISWSKAFRRVLELHLQLIKGMFISSYDTRALYEIFDVELHDMNEWLVAKEHRVNQRTSLQRLQDIAERYYERLLIAMDNMLAVVVDANHYGKDVCVDLRKRSQTALDRLKQISRERSPVDEISMQIEELTLE